MIKRPSLFKASSPTQTGKHLEQQAAQWLMARKVRIISRNFRSRFGEIDLIGYHRQELVFFEVRFRRHQHYGGAAMSVDHRKQERLLKTAQFYLTANPDAQTKPCRFDVLAITLDNSQLEYTWYKAAFTATDIYPDAF